MRKRTHQITDTSFLISVDEAMQRYQVGRAAVTKLGKDCNGIVYIGRSLRFNVKRMDEYIEHLCDSYEEPDFTDSEE